MAERDVEHTEARKTAVGIAFALVLGLAVAVSGAVKGCQVYNVLDNAQRAERHKVEIIQVQTLGACIERTSKPLECREALK